MKNQELRSALAKSENDRKKAVQIAKNAARAVQQRAPQVAKITSQMREDVKRLESRQQLGLIETAREEILAASTFAPELLSLAEEIDQAAFRVRVRLLDERLFNERDRVARI